MTDVLSLMTLCKDWAEQTNDNTIEIFGVDAYYAD